MKLKEFINLPPEHEISFADGQELHKDIALNGISILKPGQASLVIDYLESCLLHQSVEQNLISKLESVIVELRKSSRGN